MKLGQVFYWETDKAKGHDKRFKYQVFICDDDWEAGYTFLFISSDDGGGDYRITNPPYKFFPKSESYVSCSSIVTYDEDELDQIGKAVGQLTAEHLKELHDAILSSFLMEQRYIKRVCNAIRAGLA
jgi:hypothetical protein